MSKHVAIVLGTRPEIIKLAPVIRACERHNFSCTVIHTGQHYSESLDSVFFDQLNLPAADHNLGVGSASHGEQTGEILIRLERVLQTESPDIVLVQGDTNSVLAAAVVASKLDVELGHVEAGLRSFDRGMPEEINRIVADHVSDVLFAPTEQSKENLRDEGIPLSRVSVTGNTVVDALEQNRELAGEYSTVLVDLALATQSYYLLTLHRAENVDNEANFQTLLNAVGRAATRHDVPVVYPIHPRAEEKLKSFDIEVPAPIRLIEPREYLDFLRLEDQASLILTDSGGVQEEACILETPCVTLRDSTERPETVAVGANELIEYDQEHILQTVEQMRTRDGDWENPFGDGNAGERIIQTIRPQLQEVPT